jgi:hypothetical protein
MHFDCASGRSVPEAVRKICNHPLALAKPVHRRVASLGSAAIASPTACLSSGVLLGEPMRANHKDSKAAPYR